VVDETDLLALAAVFMLAFSTASLSPVRQVRPVGELVSEAKAELQLMRSPEVLARIIRGMASELEPPFFDTSSTTRTTTTVARQLLAP
jgi:hypothetical protein